MPVQVQCTILDAWGWCTWTTQRDGMGREEGGGFRMGNTKGLMTYCLHSVAAIALTTEFRENALK